MIFVDSDIPMYLIGAPHRHKTDAQRLVTDTEVLQEILHRYVAIDRRDAIQPAFEALLGAIDQVLSIDLAAVQRAKAIVLGSRQLSARDALHLAVMEQHGISRILSFDAGFDGFPGITRLSLGEFYGLPAGVAGGLASLAPFCPVCGFAVGPLITGGGSTLISSRSNTNSDPGGMFGGEFMS